MDTIINFEETTAWRRGTSSLASWTEGRDLARSVVESLAAGPASHGGLARPTTPSGKCAARSRRDCCTLPTRTSFDWLANWRTIQTMTTKALVVEDDPQVMGTIEDTLFSMGHEHLWVTNQQDARDAIHQDHFQYVLLDLQIPAKPNRGGASKEFVINLLREVSEHDATPQTPVIIMTACISECLDMSTRLLSFGASEFIAKPFANKERSLAKVIHEVLKSEVPRRHSTSTSPVDSRTDSPQQFSDGELAFLPAHLNHSA